MRKKVKRIHYLAIGGFFVLLLNSVRNIYVNQSSAIEQPEIEEQYNTHVSISSAASRVANDVLTSNKSDFVPTREFPQLKQSFPCITDDHHTTSSSKNNGLFYIKLPKCASSTAAGIAKRIAIRNHPDNNIHNFTAPTNIKTTCKVFSKHSPLMKLRSLMVQRDQTQSFLWTFVRDPTSRIISDFYHFEVSRRGVRDDSDTMINYIKKGFAKNHNWIKRFGDKFDSFQLSYLNIDPTSQHRQFNVTLHEYHLTESTIPSILQSFNFIGTVERFDESLVVLSFILFGSLRIDNFLYLPSKSSGGFDGLCNKLVPAPKYEQLPSKVQSYLSSDDWREENIGDILLYKSVDQSLDRTIDNIIGRQRFEESLVEFRRVLQMAKTQCNAQNVVFPCNIDGSKNTHTDCYTNDEGCGHRCLDDVYRTYISSLQRI